MFVNRNRALLAALRRQYWAQRARDLEFDLDVERARVAKLDAEQRAHNPHYMDLWHYLDGIVQEMWMRRSPDLAHIVRVAVIRGWVSPDAPWQHGSLLQMIADVQASLVGITFPKCSIATNVTRALDPVSTAIEDRKIRQAHVCQPLAEEAIEESEAAVAKATADYAAALAELIAVVVEQVRLAAELAIEPPAWTDLADSPDFSPPLHLRHIVTRAVLTAAPPLARDFFALAA